VVVTGRVVVDALVVVVTGTVVVVVVVGGGVTGEHELGIVVVVFVLANSGPSCAADVVVTVVATKSVLRATERSAQRRNHWYLR
jgi:hypothetical protein